VAADGTVGSRRITGGVEGADPAPAR
jgi:hypothetical protein